MVGRAHLAASCFHPNEVLICRPPQICGGALMVSTSFADGRFFVHRRPSDPRPRLFTYGPKPPDPSRSEMDSARRCAAAFLFRSYGARKGAHARPVFRRRPSANVEDPTRLPEGAKRRMGRAVFNGCAEDWGVGFLRALPRGGSLISTTHRLVSP